MDRPDSVAPGTEGDAHEAAGARLRADERSGGSGSSAWWTGTARFAEAPGGITGGAAQSRRAVPDARSTATRFRGTRKAEPRGDGCVIGRCRRAGTLCQTYHPRGQGIRRTTDDPAGAYIFGCDLERGRTGQPESKRPWIPQRPCQLDDLDCERRGDHRNPSGTQRSCRAIHGIRRQQSAGSERRGRKP